MEGKREGINYSYCEIFIDTCWKGVKGREAWVGGMVVKG